MNCFSYDEIYACTTHFCFAGVFFPLVANTADDRHPQVSRKTAKNTLRATRRTYSISYLLAAQIRAGISAFPDDQGVARENFAA